ncbi:MAG TPA: elongation factor P [Candidatus Paceibacterota bacterium]
MLQYNEITPHKFVVLDGAPHEVLTSHVFRKQMRKPVNQTKLKNLITGKVTERAFHATEQADEADIDTRNVKYLYTNKGEYWFCEESDPSKRFELSEDLVGEGGKFMKTNALVELAIFNEKIIAVVLPIKVELKVKEAAAAVRGNTVQGGTKQVTLETGATVNVPMFIGEGDVIRINTETGEYVERVEKK